MSIITRVRNSTKRITFNWSVVSDKVTIPLDLSGMTLQMLVDTEDVESNPASPLRIATIDGIITDATNGEAYFPLTTTITGTIQRLFFEVWVADTNSESYPIDSGSLIVVGSLKENP